MGLKLRCGLTTIFPPEKTSLRWNQSVDKMWETWKYLLKKNNPLLPSSTQMKTIMYIVFLCMFLHFGILLLFPYVLTSTQCFPSFLFMKFSHPAWQAFLCTSLILSRCLWLAHTTLKHLPLYKAAVFSPSLLHQQKPMQTIGLMFFSDCFLPQEREGLAGGGGGGALQRGWRA